MGGLRSLLLFLLLLVAQTVVCSTCGAQVLEQLRTDVRSSEPPSPDEPVESPRRRDDSCDRRGSYFGDSCDDDDESGLNALIAKGVFWGLTAPFWAPPVMVGDHYSATGFFSRYPYVDDIDGYQMIDPDLFSEPYDWSLRVRGEYANDFDTLERIGGHILWEGTHRLGIDTTFNYRHEDLPAGDDGLWHGDANLVFRFAQSEQIQMRAGFGTNWLHDDDGTDWGFNFTYGGDWYPVRPLVVSTEIDWGTLESAGLFHGRATVGVVWHGVEFYTGYDYYDVGTTQIDGLVGGLRVWY